MVDLGFLRITFFIFTTSLAEPKIEKLVVPDKGKVYICCGWKEALATNLLVGLNYDVSTGLGNFIRRKQK